MVRDIVPILYLVRDIVPILFRFGIQSCTQNLNYYVPIFQHFFSDRIPRSFMYQYRLDLVHDCVTISQRFLFKIVYRDVLYLVHDLEPNNNLKKKNNTRLIID